MSKHTVQVPSPYGPVNVELTRCDGPECQLACQQQFVVGWLALGYSGKSVQTMGSAPDAMDFCGIECAYKALETMVNL